jgi:hypothetical protein
MLPASESSPHLAEAALVAMDGLCELGSRPAAMLLASIRLLSPDLTCSLAAAAASVGYT